MSRKRIVILGAGGLGKALLEAFHSVDMGKQVVGFLDDGRTGDFCGKPILGRCADLPELTRKHRLTHGMVAVGYRYFSARRKYIQMVERTRCVRWIRAVHSSAAIARDVKIGEGCFVSMGCVINAGTTIGDHTVLWSGVIIEHDNEIGENVYFCTGARTSGYVRIGRDSFIGMGALITQSCVGKSATVGAGSLILRDVKERSVVWGQPARPMRVKKTDGYL